MSLSVQKSDVTEWQTSIWPKLRAKFSDDDIFHADETGLFYKLTPEKTLKFRGKKCVGGKLSKERITVMVAANMNGTIKKKLLIIGKSKNYIDYDKKQKAWMTSDIQLTTKKKKKPTFG